MNRVIRVVFKIEFRILLVSLLGIGAAIGFTLDNVMLGGISILLMVLLVGLIAFQTLIELLQYETTLLEYEDRRKEKNDNKH